MKLTIKSTLNDIFFIFSKGLNNFLWNLMVQARVINMYTRIIVSIILFVCVGWGGPKGCNRPRVITGHVSLYIFNREKRCKGEGRRKSDKRKSQRFTLHSRMKTTPQPCCPAKHVFDLNDIFGLLPLKNTLERPLSFICLILFFFLFLHLQKGKEGEERI